MFEFFVERQKCHDFKFQKFISGWPAIPATQETTSSPIYGTVTECQFWIANIAAPREIYIEDLISKLIEMNRQMQSRLVVGFSLQGGPSTPATPLDQRTYQITVFNLFLGFL